MLTPPLYKPRNGKHHVVLHPERFWFVASGVGLKLRDVNKKIIYSSKLYLFF